VERVPHRHLEAPHEQDLTPVALPDITDRDQWLAARRQLLAEEKAHTAARDALSVRRRELPMVEITEDYVFDGPDGPASLVDLFDGRRQLIVYHFMFEPSWVDGCPSCTAGTDELSPGFFDHLHARDTSYAMVSLAPLEKLERWKARRGWDVPWYSSHGTTFNADFGVTVDPSSPDASYNYRSKQEWDEIDPGFMAGDEPFEMPGRSCFLTEAGRIFHTYSQYARGLECTGGSYYFLDLTALGRQEDWEEPKGRSDETRSAAPDFSA
jgi:predicted dithiol-disulfide oxidoreductase (DUF899 family)